MTGNLLADILYKIILNCTNCCFLQPRMSPLYLNTLYLHLEQVLSTEATMFFTGQTKHLLSFSEIACCI